MSETEQPQYEARGWAGWLPEVRQYKLDVEAAIAAAGVGHWMLPAVGEPPSNLAGLGVELPGFCYAVPPEFPHPPPPDRIWPMSEATALALQVVLQGQGA